MKKYLRTCFYYNGIDTAFAFVSLAIIAIGVHELVIRAEGIINNPRSLEFLKAVSQIGLWVAIGFIMLLNYAMLLLTNPGRWVVGVFLAPVRLIFVGIILLIKSLPVIFTITTIGLTASAAEGIKQSKSRKNTHAQRKKFKEDSRNYLALAAASAGAAGITVYGSSRVSGALGSRIRSKNGQYIIVEGKEKATISTE